MGLVAQRTSLLIKCADDDCAQRVVLLLPNEELLTDESVGRQVARTALGDAAAARRAAAARLRKHTARAPAAAAARCTT